MRGNVFLVGFMGAGKTAVGRVLADRLDWPFVDLDERVEAFAGSTIPEIFASQGEESFRRLEAAALRSLEASARAVVATGGGVMNREENRTWMKQHGTTVWLDVPFALLVARLGSRPGRQRPLFADQKRARELYGRRRHQYGDSDLRIEVLSSDSVTAVAARAEALLVEEGCVI